MQDELQRLQLQACRTIVIAVAGNSRNRIDVSVVNFCVLVESQTNRNRKQPKKVYTLLGALRRSADASGSSEGVPFFFRHRKN